MVTRLVLTIPGKAPQEFCLDKPVVTLGREKGNDIVVDEISVSRFHARLIRRQTGQYTLQDLQSRNGTQVNGRPLDPDIPHVLAHGDVITLALADAQLVFYDEQATRPMPVKSRGIIVQEDTRNVYVHGQLVHPPLTQHQYRLLRLLVSKAGQVCSRDEIAQAVWPEAKGSITDEQIDALVKRLRERLSPYKPGAQLIATVPRHGFRLLEV